MTDILIQQSSRHSVYVQRIAGTIANKFDPYLKDLKKEIRSIMFDAPETTINTRIINSIIRDIREVQVELYSDYNLEVLLSDLNEFSGLEAEWQLNSLASVIEFPSVDLINPAKTQVWAAVNSQPLIFPSSNGVKLLDPFIKDIEAIEIKRISDIIRFGFITGRTSQQITKDITDKSGVLDSLTRRNIKSMVRTATNHVSTVAKEKTMKDNGDIVIGYEIIATLDGKTSDTCRFHDSAKVFNAGFIIWSTGRKEKTNRKPKSPFHANCRTAISPILDQRYAIDNSTATRASAGVTGGKQVSAKLSYYDWLKQQGNQGANGKLFVEDVLGKERAKLFLNDNLSVKEFKSLTIDDQFRPIPLDELKNKQSLQLALDD